MWKKIAQKSRPKAALRFGIEDYKVERSITNLYFTSLFSMRS